MQANNNAKLREAVKQSKLIAECTSGLRFADDDKLRDIAKVYEIALAAPARNCDAGTAMEQTLRFRAFCERHGECMDEDRPCPLLLTPGLCELAWAQMPYEEGGAK